MSSIPRCSSVQKYFQYRRSPLHPQRTETPETRDFETTNRASYKGKTAEHAAPPGPAQGVWQRTRIVVDQDACLQVLSLLAAASISLRALPLWWPVLLVVPALS